MESTGIVIPARYDSVRLPGKPLLEIKGKPLVQWVYERASLSKLASSVIVATDDRRIYDAVVTFGGNACMTSPNHQSGSDRIAEVAKLYPELQIIANVQGDEPLITPESIDAAIEALREDKSVDISTLIRKIRDKEEINNPNIVKAVIDISQNALYFSRSPIPYSRHPEFARFYAHIGLYIYRRESLLRMTELSQSPLEKAESLEQLRALQNGMRIKTVEVDYKPIGIDTLEDLEAFRLFA